MAKILIVEDDIALNQAYQIILEREGHKVAIAYNGEEALKQADSFEPEIILLDLLMPKMDGLTFLKKYDVTKKHPEVKIIILSNMGDEKKVEKSMELGAYKYIVKAHASPRQLSILVNHLINKNLSPKTE